MSADYESQPREPSHNGQSGRPGNEHPDHVKYTAPDRLPRISDTTLRDSAHMPGVDFRPEDGVVIARLLRAVGIDAIEVGIVSAADGGDLDLCRAVLDEVGARHAMTLVLARSRAQTRTDLRLSHELGFRAVMLSVPTSDEHATLKLGTASRKRIMNLAADAIRTAKDLGLHITFSAEDGARTEIAFLREYAAYGLAAGADRIRLAETVSILTPDSTRRMVSQVVAAAPGLEVEIHSHNMLGLAVANAIAAGEAGASWISATVGGLGERGGNTPLAEVLACMWRFWSDDRYQLGYLTELSQQVAARSGTSFGATSGPTAELSYSYEIAGQWQNPGAFEAVPAELVGNKRGIRVRSRLRPALMRAFLPPGVADDVDLDLFTQDVRDRFLPAGRQCLNEAGLMSLISSYAAHHNVEQGA
ncbi:MAG TPA: hypothetical protein VNF47_21875 [Streptosporangiaceae bacterium]|nr:hypothetical protein [Streptosporangiaceae bacterium]